MAEGDSDSQEKTQAPSQKRLDDARREGQVPHSRDLSSFLVLSLPALYLFAMSQDLAIAMLSLVKMGLSIEREVLLAPDLFMGHTMGLFALLAPFLALALVALLAAVVGPIAIGGLMFKADAIAPKFSRLDPLAGLGRMFGHQALVELGKSLLKAVWILGLEVLLIYLWLPAIMALGNFTLDEGLQGAGSLILWGLLLLCLATVLLAGVDLPYQLWEFNEKLKMSLQDLKDEHKETEGRPEVKGRLRARAQELARRRMMEDVAKADVVVTNPTHYAVALRYDPKRSAAPIVVGKGVDELAMRIRDVAKRAGVPQLEQAPLARSLYQHTPIGTEIPAALYASVAQVLAWVFQLREAKLRGVALRALPTVAVPEGLDPGGEV